MAPPSFNVIVIGAGEIYRFLVTQSFLAVEKLTSDGAEIGISGIAAARFYLDVHPDCRLVILEKDQCLGGVWSTRRQYENFWTQWTVGTAEFSDKPMNVPPADDTYYGFFKAKHVTQYLEEYVDWFQRGGKTLRDRIHFGTKVCNIEKLEGGWRIYCEDGKDVEKIYHTSKLMIASGLTSVPKTPDLPGLEKFQQPVVHQDKFGESSMLGLMSIHNVTILGAEKYAADMVYDGVKAGKTVSWVITGNGPGVFISPKGKGNSKHAFALSSTRVASSLTPSIFNPSTLWTKFLHSSDLGHKVVNTFWGSVDKEVRKEIKYEGKGKEPPKTPEKPNAKTLTSWQTGSETLINRPNFLDIIAKNVKIYHDDLLDLDNGIVTLKSGEKIPTDVLLCGTGWTPSIDFFSPKQLYTLGLPSPLKTVPSEDIEKWSILEHAADEEVLKRFPHLSKPPEMDQEPAETTPYRLYNGIAPLRDKSIVFIGHVLLDNYFRGAECQAIWATAYLDKQLELPSLADREAAVAYFRAWCRRRYGSNGEVLNQMTSELLGYTDQLLREVGLSSHRRGWFSDRFVPSAAGDLRGLRDEYVAKYPGMGLH